MEPVTQILHNLHGGNVLDIATGSGGFLIDLSNNIPGFKNGVGVDNNPFLIKAAVKNNQDNRINYCLMDGACLSFHHDEFDVVSISNSLHHMPEVHITLKEMHRVVKPGGAVIIQEMISDSLTETQQTHRDLHHWWAAVDRGCGISHRDTYSRKEIIALINEVDLINHQMIEFSDLESDPLDLELQNALEPVFSRYFNRLTTLPDANELFAEGQALKKRLKTVGFHSATALYIVANKPG
jgi:SAM-dependent methyltransferase